MHNTNEKEELMRMISELQSENYRLREENRELLRRMGPQMQPLDPYPTQQPWSSTSIPKNYAEWQRQYYGKSMLDWVLEDNTPKKPKKKAKPKANKNLKQLLERKII